MYPGNRKKKEEEYYQGSPKDGYNNQYQQFPQQDQWGYQQPGNQSSYQMPGNGGYDQFPAAQDYRPYDGADSRMPGNTHGGMNHNNFPQNDYNQPQFPPNDYKQDDYSSRGHNQSNDHGYTNNNNQSQGQNYNNSNQGYDQNYNSNQGYGQQQQQQYPMYNEPFPNNQGGWGQAPPANVPVPTVNYNAINYGGMEFPEFHTGGYQQGGQYQGGNYQGTPSQIQHQQTNAGISNCQGRKRALLIGINYTNSKFKLRGCINDVHRMKKFIMEHFQFKESDMVILTDDQKNPNRLPTRNNILKAMKWLVSDAKKNDSFFFHYSGHGSRVEDADGDEIDGEDETICPVDFEENGQIIDDDMNAIMVRPLPPGARLTAVFDCCHSGSALDLPFTYGASGKLKHGTGLNIAGSSIKEAGLSYMKGDIQSALGGITQSIKTLMSGDSKLDRAKQEKSSMGDVVMFSGCKDTQTSADAKEDLSFTGAMSWALTNSLYEKPRQTYIELLNDIRTRLAGKYTQVPQLSSGREMDMNTVFIM
ncbi:Metacaspase-1 [Smittium culicis]|uniref:Metacaspase-1 n=1 Tax=Smittium culicis TaxID=133412 RepID=A0A1R1XDM3_9FUNG|nr:Metacaspase-1 [Smittium culicis]OMJ18599.1 Metacaspase-1 [Smittium culicis]